MDATELGTKLVALCNAGRGMEAIDKFYSPKIVSIEGEETDAMPARLEGIEAIRGKNQWWYDNREIHASSAQGPFCGHRSDQFAVVFQMDTTDKANGERAQLTEIAIYTVSDSRIVQEEFLYLID